MKLCSIDVSSASVDCHSWQGLNFSTTILACQKRSRFRRRRVWYWRRLAYHTAVASDVFRWRDDLSNRLTSRLDCRHSPSNQGSDGRRRMVTVFASISLWRTDMISLSYSSGNWSALKFAHWSRCFSECLVQFVNAELMSADDRHNRCWRSWHR